MLIRAGLFSYAIISEAHHRKWKDIYLLSTSLSADVARRELSPVPHNQHPMGLYHYTVTIWRHKAKKVGSD